MSEIMKEFSERYELGEEGEKEMIEMFNKSLIEISSRILAQYDGKIENKNVKKEKVNKKFASKKAEEYAYENNLSLDDFENEKVSKKDIEEKVRKITKEKNSVNVVKSSTSKEERKVLCCGLTKKGDQCNRAGTLKPNGAKKLYCFRHADEWNAFECDSDSSDEEDLKIENLHIKNVKKNESDSE